MKKLFICFIVIMMLVITMTGCKKKNIPEKEQNSVDNNVISDTVNNSSQNVENHDNTVQNTENEDKNDVIDTSQSSENKANNEGGIESAQNNDNTQVLDTSDGEGITEDLEIQIDDNEGIGGV